MAFGKAVQNKNQEALLEYQDALAAYSAACREITKIRLLADHPAASDADLARYHRAKQKFKQSCREYNQARTKFMLAMRNMSVKQTELTDQEYISQYEGYNFQNTAREIRQVNALNDIGDEKLEQIKAELEAFVQIPMDQREEALKKLERGESIKDQFKNSKGNDPTNGDFDPI